MGITWDTAYETGHAEIDLQHRQLLAIVQELESAETQEHRSHEVIVGVLNHVMDFTILHFAMEEGLMRRVGYPLAARDEMIRQHEEFTAYARLRVLEFRENCLVSVLPLRDFLAEWLLVHELGLDSRLASFIRDRSSIVLEPEISA